MAVSGTSAVPDLLRLQHDYVAGCRRGCEKIVRARRRVEDSTSVRRDEATQPWRFFHILVGWALEPTRYGTVEYLGMTEAVRASAFQAEGLTYRTFVNASGMRAYHTTWAQVPTLQGQTH